MSFGEAVTTVLTRKYATFTGRAGRAEYWWFQLFNVVVLFALGGLGSATHSSFFSAIYFIYLLAIIIPGLAVGVRRLHDTGRSGGWLFISMVPFVGGLVLLVFTAIEGQPGPNAYGPPVTGSGAPKVAAFTPSA